MSEGFGHQCGEGWVAEKRDSRHRPDLDDRPAPVGIRPVLCSFTATFAGKKAFAPNRERGERPGLGESRSTAMRLTRLKIKKVTAYFSFEKPLLQACVGGKGDTGNLGTFLYRGGRKSKELANFFGDPDRPGHSFFSPLRDHVELVLQRPDSGKRRSPARPIPDVFRSDTTF